MSLKMDEGNNKHNDSKNSRKRKKARRGSKSNTKHQACSTDNGKPPHGSSATVEERTTIDGVNEKISSHEAVGKAHEHCRHEQVEIPVTAGGDTTKITTASSSGNSSSINPASKKSKKRRRQERAASSSGAIGTNPQPTDQKTCSRSAGDTNRSAPAVHQKEVDTRNPVAKSNRAGGRAGIDSSNKAAKTPAPRLSDLQKRMRQKLEGAQFRMINETLYTSESGASLAKFKGEPELFDVVST